MHPPRWRTARAARRLLIACALIALGVLSGCSSVSYFWQSASGQLALMQAARPVDDWLQDPAVPTALKTRLTLARQIRGFAVTEIQLPDNASYQRYADLQRPAAVWNVLAAPELSLRLQPWCFPVAGCVGYKGFFERADAEAEAASLRAGGLEVSVQPVPAYSTLGWLNWAGGDPLLSTFIDYPEGELARLIFHELAHQVVYAPGDTAFNESFASTVEQLGSVRWLARHASPAAQAAHASAQARRQQFRALTLGLQRELREIYGETDDQDLLPAKDTGAPKVAPQANTDTVAGPGWPADRPAAPPLTARARAAMLERKAAAIQAFRARHAALKASWGGYAGYDGWVAHSNNAALGALAAYDSLVPGFETLFEREGRDWQRFYTAVQRLANQPKSDRRAALLRAEAGQR